MLESQLPKTIALIGNPNCGKTTLFNNLTGSHQKVGNWSGVTVEKKTGALKIDNQSADLIDLPGIYSLEQEYQGLDEQIARTFLENEKIDLIINIIDSSNLERNLVLTNQLIELNKPMVIVLNMQDVAEDQGISVDAKVLEHRLGIPVVSSVASLKKGMQHLKQHLLEQINPETQKIAEVTPEYRADDKTKVNEKILRRYQQAHLLTEGIINESSKVPLTEKLDRWLLHRWLGIPIFLVLMYVLFTLTINVGAMFINFFDILFTALFVDMSRWLLTEINTPELIITLLSTGLGGGVTLVLTFIPVIGFLYLGLSLLEDSGYISRAAFVVDRLMAKLGLPGNAFVPLIVGFGCNVPSVMASRSLGRQSDRLMTIAMAPFMSCGARLTVYALFAAAFFPHQGQNVVFMLYILGIAMAVLTGYIFRKQIFAEEITPSFQEMPAFHRPVARNILFMTWFKLRGFVMKAGKTIVKVVILLSLLNSLGTDGSYGNENTKISVLSVIGKTITPAFKPIGIEEDNWPATVGLFTGMFAKEAVVGTLNALYSDTTIALDNERPDLAAAFVVAVHSVGDAMMDIGTVLLDPLGISIGDVTDKNEVAVTQNVDVATIGNMSALFGSSLAAVSYLVFILLYAPCVAVVGAMVRESGIRWAVIVFSWSTALAYFVSSTIYQLGTITQHPSYSLLVMFFTSLSMLIFIINLKKLAGNLSDRTIIPVVQIEA